MSTEKKPQYFFRLFKKGSAGLSQNIFACCLITQINLQVDYLVTGRSNAKLWNFTSVLRRCKVQCQKKMVEWWKKTYISILDTSLLQFCLLILLTLFVVASVGKTFCYWSHTPKAWMLCSNKLRKYPIRKFVY